MTGKTFEISPNKIKVRKLFSTLFPVNNELKNKIKENMEANGFDNSKPIDIWNGICVDGHTRLAAAKEVGLDVIVFEHDFKDEQEALEYAIHNQRNRRNLTQEELVKCIAILDKRKTKAEAGASKSKFVGGRKQTSFGVSSDKTAKLIGTSSSTVERVRTVLDSGDKETQEKMKSGEISISKAYQEIIEKRKVTEKKAKSTFNKTNEKIEWASWSWNPVFGCEHGCEYCYARDIGYRFYGHFNPTFFSERLDAPQNTKPLQDNGQGGKSVFVCSMADLFGKWVPQEWIDKVMESVRTSPQWTFIFLTKNPERLADIDFPDNAWVGATVDKQMRVERTEKAFEKVKAKIKFVSCEPMLEPIIFNNIKLFDWIIVGGQSRTSTCEEFQPKWEWVEALLKQAHKSKVMVYFKPNMKARPREYPISK